jgi:hypothetical protein
MEFGKSQKGGNILFYDGFKYRVDKKREGYQPGDAADLLVREG